MNYVLVGAGGTGSHLCNTLYKYLKAREQEDPDWMLYIIDGDHVTVGNISRQNFRVGDIDKNKAEALFDRINDPEHVQAIPKYLGEEDIEQYVADGDVVLIGADNYWVRKLIHERAIELDNITVINGGNEMNSGSVQLFIRENGVNITPSIAHLHPEITDAQPTTDRSVMSCAQIAELPGGEQTILANMTSAVFMLAALWRFHAGYYFGAPTTEPGHVGWTQVQFDHHEGTYVPWDVRNTKNWETNA